MNKAMREIAASFVAVLLCLTVVSLPAPVRGESLRRPTPDSLARPQALVHKLGLDVSPGALFRTDDFFKGANAAGKEFGATLSVHLKYAFQFGPETRFGRNYPFTYPDWSVRRRASNRTRGRNSTRSPATAAPPARRCAHAGTTTPSPIKASDWVTTPFSTAPRSVRP